MNQVADLQPELNLRTRHARCTVCADSVNELCGLLRGRGKLKAEELMRLRPEWTKRFIRELASASEGRVISAPGMPYMLLSTAETSVLEHAGKSLISQGRKMVRRGIHFLRIAGVRKAEAQLTSATNS